MTLSSWSSYITFSFTPPTWCLRCIVLLLITVSWLIFFSSSTYANNVIKNAEFEESLDEWKDHTGGEAVSLTHTTEDRHGGEKSLRVTNTKTASYGAQQSISGIEANQNYQLQGWVKLINSDTREVRIRIAWYQTPDASGTQMQTQDTEAISAVNEWRLLTAIVTAPESAQSAKIRLILSSAETGKSASAYFDDLSLARVDIPLTPTSAPLPSFTPTPSDSMPAPTSPTSVPPPLNSSDFLSITQVPPSPAATPTDSTPYVTHHVIQNLISTDSTVSAVNLSTTHPPKRDTMIGISFIAAGLLSISGALYLFIRKYTLHWLIQV